MRPRWTVVFGLVLISRSSLGQVPIRGEPRAQGDARQGVEPPVDAPKTVDPSAPQPALPTATGVTPPIEITVHGGREPKPTGISAAASRQLPGAFGDPFRAIEVLPGVTPMATGLPYFYVRGAPPGNVGYYLDGVQLPALYHAVVGPSVVHPAFIDRVELFPGPYPARYGHMAGAVVAAESAPPSLRLRGEASLRLVDAGVMLEAPLRDGQTDVMMAGRYSYTGTVLSQLVPDLDIGYWDYQTRVVQRLGGEREVSLFALGSHDFLARRQSGRMTTLYDVTFHRLKLGLDSSTSGGGLLRLSLTGGLDHSASEQDGFRARDRSLGARADFEQRSGPTLLVRAGSEAGLHHYEITSSPLTNNDELLGDFSSRFTTRSEFILGAYVEALLEPERGVRVLPGLRADFYGASDGDFGLSPRVLAELDIGESVTVIHGLGVAQQPPSFAIPIPGLVPTAGGGLQKAVQSSAGVRLKLPESFSTSLTLFQSVTFDMTDALGVSRLDNGDFSLEQSDRSLGSARGLELMIQRSLARRVGGFLSYTLSRAERSLGRASGPSSFDRTHVFNLALAFDLGRGYRAGGRVSAYSGIPGDVAYVEAARRPPRTAPFYRFDWRLEKRWVLRGQGAFVALVAEVLNTTLHEEVLNRSCSAYTCRDDVLGPITIPSIGVEAAF